MDEKTAREVSALVDHPAWKALTNEIEVGVEAYWERLAKTLARAGAQVDHDELQYMRGRLDGALLVLKQPGKALRLLVKIEEQKEGPAPR